MTTFYMDPVNGNDAADGLSFANRWKTLTAGATAARIAPGDTIRVIASPDPVSIGAAQWTDNSRIVTPVTPVNKVAENCDSGWTGATNITVAHGTTTPARPKAGTAYLNLTPATAFTTGKMAYKAFGSTQDFSAYQQISFWFQANSAAGTQQYQVVLCSDSTGDVPVDSLSFDAVALGVATNVWRNIVLDKGSALSSGINSIAIYATADPGTVQSRFDNIVACKAPGAADEITHLTLIGKNTGAEPEWYNIQEITNTTLLIGGSRDSLINFDAPMPYRGVTESVTTFTRTPLIGWDSSGRTLTEGGTSLSAMITYSGGWNRTDMSTQTGQTWLTGRMFDVIGITASTSARDYIAIKNFGFAHYASGGTGVLGTLNHGWDVDLRGIIACGTAFNIPALSTDPSDAIVNCDQIWALNDNLMLTPGFAPRLTIKRIHGTTDDSVNTGAFSMTGSIANLGHDYNWIVDKIDNNKQSGLVVNNQNLKFRNCVFENNAVDVSTAGSIGADLTLDNCTLNSATKVAINGSSNTEIVRETNIGNDPTLHRTTITGGSWFTQSAVTHSAGVAWEIKPTSTRYEAEWPLKIPLAKIAVNANKLVTIKCWLRRNNTGLSLGLFLPNKALPGVARTTVLMTAAVDTWEEVTITCTPTSGGVLTVYGIAYGGTTFSGFFDDITITQAT